MQKQRVRKKPVKVRIVQFPHGAGLPLPAYQSEGAAGLDLLAAVPADKPIVIAPHTHKSIPTGIAISLPHATEAQVRPRSGLAIKHGITVLNTPGTIDSDYRGEIHVILVNLGSESFSVARGERIAQLIIAPVLYAQLLEQKSLDKTVRGTKGLGSTGTAAIDKKGKNRP